MKVLIQMIVVTIILCSSSCKNHNFSEENIPFGWESRLLTSRLPMNCQTNYLAIYDEMSAYRFKSEEYHISMPTDKILGKDHFKFFISITDTSIIKTFYNGSISFCLNGETYIGRALDQSYASWPPVCHFYYSLNTQDQFDLLNKNELLCFSTKYYGMEEYKKEILGIDE